MGIAERKTREKEERKRLILRRATELILVKGIPAVSMQDIANAAELSKATLYLYFESKEAILSEILADAADSFASYVEENLDKEDNGIEALKKLWGAYLRFFGESPDIFVLTGIKRYINPYLGDDETLAASRSEQAIMRMHKLIAKVIALGVRDGTLDGSLKPEKIAHIAIMIAMAIIDNVASLPRETLDVRHVQEEIKETLELLLRGVAATGIDRALLTLPIEKE